MKSHPPDSQATSRIRLLVELVAGLRAPVSRRDYVAAGLLLFVAKYLVEDAIVLAATGRAMPPVAFLTPLFSLRAGALGQTMPDWAYFALAVSTLPFLWIGLTMSVRRAMDAGISPWWGLGFVLPILNYGTIGVLALLPTQAPVAPASVPGSPYRAPPRPAGDAESGGVMRRAVLAVLVPVPLGLAMTAFSVFALRSYGAVLFFATPCGLGALTAWIYNRPIRRSLKATLGVVALATMATGFAMGLFALEGLLCILMAAPIALCLALVGGAVGWLYLAGRAVTWASGASALLAFPGAAGVEARVAAPALREVQTAIEIDAPPEKVWHHVVAFSELPPPPEWFFQMGIAYPQRARIQGHGVGAVRRCEFSTGAFVEPITVWDEPRRLAFDVIEQPPSMKEWSPYARIDAPHLEGYMVSRRGEFRLTALPSGRTRLEGSTWYTLGIYPEAYWTLFSDRLLHAIHARVLAHIKWSAEASTWQ